MVHSYLNDFETPFDCKHKYIILLLLSWLLLSLSKFDHPKTRSAASNEKEKSVVWSLKVLDLRALDYNFTSTRAVVSWPVGRGFTFDKTRLHRRNRFYSSMVGATRHQGNHWTPHRLRLACRPTTTIKSWPFRFTTTTNRNDVINTIHIIYKYILIHTKAYTHNYVIS